MRFLKWAAFGVLGAGAILSGTLMVFGLAVAGSKDVAAEQSLHAKHLAATISAQPAHLYLTIATGIGDDNPAYVPSDFSVPRNSLVEVTIVNFDDATPLTGDQVKYAKVYGVIGNSATLTPIDVKDPNGPATSSVEPYTSMDPNQVSHTFTIPELNVNVPIWPHSRTTFTFRTGKAGSVLWLCEDPCGGAMATPRYMSGQLRVV